jgi:hypothetical protein
MKKYERQQFIIDYINEHKQADVLIIEFVDQYIKKFNLKYTKTNWGANKCPQLSKDLKLLYDCGIIDRTPISLLCNWEPGLPKWVYVYYKREK